MTHNQPSRSNRRRAGKPLRLALLLSTLLVPGRAMAQEAEVLAPIDLFDAGRSLGVNVAPGLVLHPQAELVGQYDSNVYNFETGKLDDIVAIFRPELLLRTEIDRHYSELNLSGEFRRYTDITDENSEQFQVSGLTRLDLGSRVALTAEGGIGRRIDMRGTAGDQFFTDAPVHYRHAWAGAELSRTGGSLELFGGGDITDFDYANATSLGVPVDLTGRDVQILTAHVRAQYALGPATRLFVHAEGNQVQYDLFTGTQRNSSGFSLLAGINYQVSELVEAEAALGFDSQDFRDPTVSSVRGLDFSLAVSWTPTPRLRLTASGEHAIDASPLGNVPALARTQFDLGAQTVMSDRILLETEIGFMEEDYVGIARTDNRYFANAGVRVRITDNLQGLAQVGYRKQDSDLAGESYDGVSVGVGISVHI